MTYTTTHRVKSRLTSILCTTWCVVFVLGWIMTYADKLKSPKWQKKRLEILERDEWKCKNCGEDGKTLHVHHKKYTNGKDPWDYNNDNFVTLCNDCHGIISNKFGIILEKATNLKYDASCFKKEILHTVYEYVYFKEPDYKVFLEKFKEDIINNDNIRIKIYVEYK